MDRRLPTRRRLWLPSCSLPPCTSLPQLPPTPRGALVQEASRRSLAILALHRLQPPLWSHRRGRWSRCCCMRGAWGWTCWAHATTRALHRCSRLNARIEAQSQCGSSRSSPPAAAPPPPPAAAADEPLRSSSEMETHRRHSRRRQQQQMTTIRSAE